MNLQGSSTIGGIRRIRGIETTQVLLAASNYVKSFQPLYADTYLFDWRYPALKGSYSLNSKTGEIKLIIEDAKEIADFAQWFTESIAYKKISLQIIDENNAAQVVHFCMATDFTKLTDTDRNTSLRYEIVFQPSKISEPKEYNQFNAIKELLITDKTYPLSAGGEVNRKGVEIILQDYVNPSFITLALGSSKRASLARKINSQHLFLDYGTHYIFAQSKTTPILYQSIKLVLNQDSSYSDLTLQ